MSCAVRLEFGGRLDLFVVPTAPLLSVVEQLFLGFVGLVDVSLVYMVILDQGARIPSGPFR